MRRVFVNFTVIMTTQARSAANRFDHVISSSVILQITPEIGDEFTEIKIWQDGNRDMVALGPTSARMKFSRNVSVASLLEHIDAFITAEMDKIQQINTQNMQRNSRHSPSSWQTSSTHRINKLSFEGTNFLSSRYSSVESVGLKSAAAFQVEYAADMIVHMANVECCTIA